MTDLPERLLPARPCSGGPGLGGEAGSFSEPDELTVQQGSPAGSHHHVLTSCVTRALGSACPDGQDTGRGSAKESSEISEGMAGNRHRG